MTRADLFGTALSPGRDASLARARYTGAMQDTIEFRGSYQYASAELLERAVTAARQNLDGDERAARIAWPDCLTLDGTTLHLHASVGEDLKPLFLDAVLRVLSETASHGAIETRKGGKPHEYYFVENDTTA